MNPFLPTILKDTYTLSSLKHKLNILKLYLTKNLFGASTAQTQTDFEADDLDWLKSLSPQVLQNFNKDNVYNTFSQVEKEISTLKTLTMYLTFEPDEQTVAQIGNFTKKTFPNIHLLDIKYDPNLIAGTALVWKGVFKDYSLRASIEQKKALILENFKKFLR